MFLTISESLVLHGYAGMHNDFMHFASKERLTSSLHERIASLRGTCSLTYHVLIGLGCCVPCGWRLISFPKLISISLSIIVTMAVTHSAVFAQPADDLKNLTCKIRAVEADKCSALPTLQSGLLTVAKQGTFRLQAQYLSCFAAEQVTHSGRFRAFHIGKTLRIELLTLEASGTENVTVDFPRTLGIANLDNATLNGYWIDIAAVVRGQGRHAEKITSAELQCEIDE